MTNKLVGCERCSDYDKIKEELNNNKKQAEKDVKDSLKNCESSKKKLQKQLLTLGAIAIVAGTILGKDFVDKIAEYIDSFNSVKDGASKLVGQADAPSPPVVAKVDDNENEPEEEEKKSEDSVYVFEPFGGGMIDMSWMRNDYSVSIVDMLTYDALYPSNDMINPFIPESLIMDEMFMPLNASEVWDLTTYSVDVPYITEFDFLTDTSPFIQQPPPIFVPSNGAWSAFILPLVMRRPRKR